MTQRNDVLLHLDSALVIMMNTGNDKAAVYVRTYTQRNQINGQFNCLVTHIKASVFIELITCTLLFGIHLKIGRSFMLITQLFDASAASELLFTFDSITNIQPEFFILEVILGSLLQLMPQM